MSTDTRAVMVITKMRFSTPMASQFDSGGLMALPAPPCSTAAICSS